MSSSKILSDTIINVPLRKINSEIGGDVSSMILKEVMSKIPQRVHLIIVNEISRLWLNEKN